MNVSEVMTLLETNKNERGIASWQAMEHNGDPLASFGIGLTQLRKLAKTIGRDHVLAQALWQLDNYDAKIVGLLIDEPKKVTEDQAEAQVEELDHGMLAHVFSSCDATLAKTSFVTSLAVRWIRHEDETRRRCGYGLLYEISKDKRKKAPDEAFFLAQITHIHRSYPAAGRRERMGMGGALMGIGKRSKPLNAAALLVAQEMGAIPGEPGCDPFNVVKHLTSPYLVKKLGL